MMNQDNPYAMNQTCKVCGEPAAGFHFGAFTCEGCKSFFGRSYNNLSSITDCKNNGECIINKKNRTACKACRLKKCLMVGMSKSGSRYGRRSNWFKIHCLLQEQQQQAVAAMAAHHNTQQAGGGGGGGPSGGPGGMPNGVKGMSGQGSAAAAAALGMLGHPGGYPGLYAAAAAGGGGPRSKEELMMLGLDVSGDYGMLKHPSVVASPSVSSPDSHNSDSSVEVSVRGNPLLHLGAKTNASGGSASTPGGDVNQSTSTAPGRPPQLQQRKDMPQFHLPLPFPGLGSMSVMPPPPFLPPSHLLFPGYHPALYQHHQGLLKPTPEQQQQQAAVAAAAVQHLFNSSSAAGQRGFAPTAASSPFGNHHPLEEAPPGHPHNHSSSNNSQNSQNQHQHQHQHHILANGGKGVSAADELTKRFYLDAVLKSQQHGSPPPMATKLAPLQHTKQDYSISALVTPNSESGGGRVKSRQSNGGQGEETAREETSDKEENVDETEDEHDEEEEEEDLVVSMTPPHSPAQQLLDQDQDQDLALSPSVAQDNPIDLSMKTTGSSLSSKSSCQDIDVEPPEPLSSDRSEKIEDDEDAVEEEEDEEVKVTAEDEEEEEQEQEDPKEQTHNNNNSISSNNNNNNNNNNNSNNNNNNNNNSLSDNEANDTIKRKLDELIEEASSGKRLRLSEASPVKALALDLTTKV